MELRFRALVEAEPGPVWRSCFERAWPGCQEWFLSQGDAARPSYLECRRAMREHLPGLVSLWQALTDLAGGGDAVARMLSLWQPAPYMAGCSQLIWPGPEPVMVRNYDYHPSFCEGTFLRTAWSGVPVLASSDCLWGAVDGMNQHGLCVALAFAGRRAVGPGFGIPLLLRHALQGCADVPAAVAALCRVPSHMSYHVTMLDAAGRYGRLSLAPDRAPVWSVTPVTTNHGAVVEWPEHAAVTRSVERAALLHRCLSGPGESEGSVVARFLKPPLFQAKYRRGFGTLYTAVYRPDRRSADFLWPAEVWSQSLSQFVPRERVAHYSARAESV